MPQALNLLGLSPWAENLAKIMRYPKMFVVFFLPTQVRGIELLNFKNVLKYNFLLPGLPRLSLFASFPDAIFFVVSSPSMNEL